MPDENAKRNGAKWLLVVLLVSAIFAVLFLAGFFNDMYKRNYSDNRESPTAVNGNQ